MHVIRLKHSTSTGHRIPGHQDGRGKCARLHGHTYTFEVILAAAVLEQGFVVDFGDIKRVLDEWDHRMLLWTNDPMLIAGRDARVLHEFSDDLSGIIRVPFIPTAENMAHHLSSRFLREFENVQTASVEVKETETSSAEAYLSAKEVEVEDARAS